MAGHTPSAVAIREDIVTEKPGLEDSSNTLLAGTPIFPVHTQQGMVTVTEKGQVSLGVSHETRFAI